MKNNYLKLLWLFILIAPQFLIASNKVLIIAGAGGLDNFKSQFYNQATELQRLLIDNYGYSQADIQVFVANNPDSIEVKYPESTAQNITAYFDEKAREFTAASTFFCFLIGHGSYDNEWGKFNLVGTDLRDIDYSQLLSQLKSRKILFVNMASASGPFLDKISRKNRVVITATRDGFEKNATQFAEQFLSTLSNSENSDLNKDGRISATELFISTRDRVVGYYDSKKQLRPEHPVLDDNGDGFGTEMPDLLEGDGMLANDIILNQVIDEKAASLNPVSTNAVDDIRKQNILIMIKALQKKKNTLDVDDYYDELEKLMIELAKITQEKN